MAVMGATASMVPGTGEVCIWADCAAVVQGYAKLPAIADDPRNTHAGYWRMVRQHLPVRDGVAVRKVKAHRARADVPEDELAVWAGNEEADLWAKRAADDRNGQWGCAINPGVAPLQALPRVQAAARSLPRKRVVPFVPVGRCDIKGRNGMGFAGAEEESARNVCPLSTKYTHLTCHPFEQSAQPRWGCLCLWPLPRVAPHKR